MHSKRKPVIAGNWKMFNTTSEAATLVNELIPVVARFSDREIVVCPPFTALAAVRPILGETGIKLGAQKALTCQPYPVAGSAEFAVHRCNKADAALPARHGVVHRRAVA